VTDISEFARLAYAAGITPLDYAEDQVSTLIAAHLAAAEETGTALRPESHTAIATMSRHITAAFLNAGWAMPGNAHEPAESEVTP
jgi:hypothetical protein